MINLCVADITQLCVETIVNSIHPRLTVNYETGVDGKIKALCGDKLMEDLKKELDGDERKEFGYAFITKSYGLNCENIIHVVSPRTEEDDGYVFDYDCLHLSYMNVLNLAKEKGIKEIVFPNLCTGNYGKKLDDVSPVAFKAINQWIEINKKYHINVYIANYNKSDLEVNEKILTQLGIEYALCNLPTIKER